MNYQETVKYLFSSLPVYQRVGQAAYKADLGTSLALDKYFGHPHEHYKTIHIAGTNGKGSVSHMLTSVLMESGYNTGLYTSPHLLDFRERIRVNGEMIPENEVVAFVRDHMVLIEKEKSSFFEMTVAMAFKYFADQEVDVAVIETGMGGRLDSTNIICPVLTIITNIGMDHTQFLGSSLEEIAGEKAGIIKEGIPIIIGESQDETEHVFIERAGEMGSEITFADRNYKVEMSDQTAEPGQSNINVLSKGEILISEQPVDLGGDYQRRNLQTLMQALDCLEGKFNISMADIRAGMSSVTANTNLLGRWQVIGTKPLVICDTAHNYEGLKAVINQLSALDISRIHIIIGLVSDKPSQRILALFPARAIYYFTRASISRSLDENELMAIAIDSGLKGQAFSNVEKAYNEAIRQAKEKDLVFVCGSTFVVADLLEIFDGKLR